jgi:hypothetical protein
LRTTRFIRSPPMLLSMWIAPSVQNTLSPAC